MSLGTVALRRKIASAGDLQSVVRTMKALAAANIGQYERAVAALGTYARTTELGLGECFRQAGPAAVLDQARHPPAGGTAASIAAVVFGSDQGLVGRFNEVVAEHVVGALAALPGTAVVWAVGERVHAHLADAGLTPRGLHAVPGSVQAVTPLVAQILVDTQRLDLPDRPAELHLFHNRPVAGGAYVPVSQRLLPLDDRWRRELAALRWPTALLPQVLGAGGATLRTLVREYLFVSIFQACAESMASENASRLAAMERAERNIGELLEDLHARFRRERQSAIDEELFDVIAGFEALRPAGGRPGPGADGRVHDRDVDPASPSGGMRQTLHRTTKENP